jgi:hypothetical protein
MSATHSYALIDAKIYAGTVGMAVSAVATTSQELARINGAVNIELTFEKIDAYWRTRALQDTETFRTGVALTCEEVQFRASTLNKIFKNVGYASTPYVATTATSFRWRITTSTAPKQVKMIFEFTRTSDNKKMAIYFPRAESNNFPIPLGGEDFIKQNMTFRAVATGANIMDLYIKKS